MMGTHRPHGHPLPEIDAARHPGGVDFCSGQAFGTAPNLAVNVPQF
jgi:hypothetical protein